MNNHRMRTYEEINHEGIKAMSEPYGNPFLEKEARIRLDERIRVIEWFLGDRRTLYSGREMSEIARSWHHTKVLI